MAIDQGWQLDTGLALPPPTTDLDTARADLDRFGLAIVAEALTPDELAAMRIRLLEQAAAERERGLASLEHDGANQRVWNLVNKGAVFNEVLGKPFVTELIGHLLGRPFLLSSNTANIAGRGGEEMVLHTDQGYAPLDITVPLVANVMWMVDDFTEENGATRVVPGSHRSGSHPDPRDRPETVAATGPAGSALVFDGRLWHGTGRNVTDRPRHGVLTYFARPFVRTQEDFSLSVADEVLDAAPPWLLELLGFRVWRTLGGVEGPHGRPDQPPAEVEREVEGPDPSFAFRGRFTRRAADPIGELRPSRPVDG
jgi:ectoine hydroxylase-related dioxygenase (phytanoyl-CoA dioxygenase family)